MRCFCTAVAAHCWFACTEPSIYICPLPNTDSSIEPAHLLVPPYLPIGVTSIQHSTFNYRAGARACTAVPSNRGICVCLILYVQNKCTVLSSFEIEDFVETHICKLCAIIRSRVLLDILIKDIGRRLPLELQQ